MSFRYRFTKCLSVSFYTLCSIAFSVSLLFACAYFNHIAICIVIFIAIMKNKFAFDRRKNTDEDTTYVFDCETIICIDFCFTVFCTVSLIVLIIVETINHNVANLVSYLIAPIALVSIHLQTSPILVLKTIKKEWKFIVVYVVNLFIMNLSIMFEFVYTFSISKYPHKQFVLAIFISIILLVGNIILMVVKPIRDKVSRQEILIILLTDGIVRLIYALIIATLLSFNYFIFALFMGVIALLGALISYKVKTAKTGDGSVSY